MMNYLCVISALLVLASVVTPGTEAFAPVPAIRATSRSSRLFSASTSRTTNTFTNKELQLEEREDKDTSITELWLNADSSVTIGLSDGPTLQSYKGTWSFDQDDKEHAFRMTLVRTYNAGDHTGPNQVGEFSFNVQRDFWGDVDVIAGEFVSAVGQIHGLDEAAKVDCEVGFFSLIDASSDGVQVEK